MDFVGLEYGVLQFRGELRQQWLEGAPADSLPRPCHIQRSTLTLQDLKDQYGFITTDEGQPYITEEVEETTQKHMLIQAPPSKDWSRVYRVKIDETVEEADDVKDLQYSVWEGHVAPGIMFIETIYRRPNAGIEAGPRSSQIAQAAYESRYPMDTLKHIIVADVVHKPTKHFVKKQLYTKEKGLSWPDEELVEWPRGTPEYKALLGTKIGCVVAYMLLGAFPAGTRRISGIMTCTHYLTLYMRFDIEPVPPPGPIFVCSKRKLLEEYVNLAKRTKQE